MNLCLYCHTPFIEQASWQMFIGITEERYLCPPCEAKLEKITNNICKLCGRKYIQDPKVFSQKELCNDCIKWENDENWSGLLTKNRSLFVYNDFLKEVMARFKYRGDVELANIFAKPLQHLLKDYPQNAIIVPIPLSEKRLYERGFNQADVLANFLGKPHYLLKRVGSEEKQSKKSRKQRLDKFKKNSFVLSEMVNNSTINNDIIVVDDIYTTGVTIRNVAKVLIKNGAKSISSITIAR